MKNINVLLLAICFLLYGCVEPIDVNTGSGEIQMVVDGTIVYDPNDPEKTIKDTILVSRSSAYLDNGSIPYVNDAFLTVTNIQTLRIDTLKFIGNGRYITQNLKPQIDSIYRLDILFSNGESYYAVSQVNRLCNFVSLTTVDTVRTVGPGGPIPAGGFVKLKAIDPAGAGDSYRLKYYVKRNPVADNPYYKTPADAQWKFFAEERNMTIVSESTDANNSPNSGFVQESEFNLPVRIRVNRVLGNDGENNDLPNYYPGDSIKVGIYSITMDNLFFLYRVRQEVSNGGGGGFSGLFSKPVANVPTNLINKNPTSSKKALGWFGGASLAEKSTEMLDYLDD